MIHRAYKKIHNWCIALIKSIPTLFGSTLLLFVFSLFIFQSFPLIVGNIFFGGVKHLYNVSIAQSLFIIPTKYQLYDTPPMYAHYQLSRTYFIQGNLDMALEEIKKEIEIHPSNTKSYYILGLTYGYMNHTQAGIDAFSMYIDANPRTWAARNDKAWLQFKIGDIDGAVKTIEPIVKEQAHNIWVQNTYCALMINKKKYIEAKKACEDAKLYASITTEDMWGRSYPGNDPRIHDIGLQSMRESIERNLTLINEKIR